VSLPFHRVSGDARRLSLYMDSILGGRSLYFRAPWAASFSKAETSDRDFTTLDGSTVQAPTMHSAELNGFYGERDGYQFVDLSLRDEKLSTIFILPDLDQFEAF